MLTFCFSAIALLAVLALSLLAIVATSTLTARSITRASLVNTKEHAELSQKLESILREIGSLRDEEHRGDATN